MAAAARNISSKDRSLIVRRSRGLLQQHMDRLAALPAHGNRVVHVHQLVHAMLLSFFDPLLRSLRGIEACGDFDGALDLPRLARSTTADALAVFDPAHLKPLIDDLRERVPDLQHVDAKLDGIVRRIVAADGTYLTTLCNVIWALKHTKKNGKTQGQVRANVQMDVDGWAPQVVSVSGDDHESEPAAFAKDLLADVLYVIDRNFCNFDFMNAVLDKGSDFVQRIKKSSPAVTVVDEIPLRAADVEAGVVSDQIVTLPGRGAPAGRLRLVTICRTDRNGRPDIIRLLTNLVDPSIAAHVVGDVYRLRWQIELFFKWFKTWARMDHLLSTSRNGIQFQLYIAVIAVLMMHVQSGYRVSKISLIVMGRIARGQMGLEQGLATIEKFERERAMERARQARRRARKKLV